jgi:hypothetical protein
MLRTEKMLIASERYAPLKIEEDRCLAEISDFNSLIAKSQDAQTPVFALSDEQIELTGVVLERTKKSREMFKTIFTRLSEIVVELTK